MATTVSQMATECCCGCGRGCGGCGGCWLLVLGFWLFVVGCYCFTVLEVGSTLLAALIATQGVRITSPGPAPEFLPRRVDHRQLSDPQNKRPKPASSAFSCPEPEFSPCASELVHSPETSWKDNPTNQRTLGGFGPDLPCYPPLSHGSSRFGADYRRTRGSENPTGGSASLFEVRHCGLSFPCDLRVAHAQGCRRRGL